MQKQLKLDQSRLLGFKILSKGPTADAVVMGAKVGRKPVVGAVVMGAKIGAVKQAPKPGDRKPTY